MICLKLILKFRFRIRTLENENSSFKDHLRLATDESKRLQERTKELKSKNSGLQGDIDDLSKQKDDTLLRYTNYIRLKNKKTRCCH